MLNKRVASLVLAGMLVFSGFNAYGAQVKVSDIEGRWSYSVITKWVEDGYISLGTGNQFLPTKVETGKEFAALANSALNLKLNFANPDQGLTRESAAVAIANALKLDQTVTGTTQFTDDAQIASSAKVAVLALIEKGIFNGYQDGSFKPGKMLSREEAVAILDRISMINLNYAKGTLQTTGYGQVEGLTANEDKSLEWLGVPYAKAPVGELRWKAPQEPDSWEGVKEAKAFGNASLQMSGANIIGSEDCLYLNIFRPNTDAKNLPVLFYIHGGNNQTGSGASFNGDVLAANANAVVVSINYRLGALGWLNVDAIKTGNDLEDSGNFGLLDIHQALNWVNDNIKAFGGNPNNITISGQSAGGRDVMALLISPIFDGDYQKAYCISGGMTVTDPQVGENIDMKALAKLVVEDKLAADEAAAVTWLGSGTSEAVDYLKAMPGERLAKLMTNASIRMSVFPHLFADGVVLPEEGFEVMATGDYNQVPTILGSCASEFSVFSAFDPYFVGTMMGGAIETDPVLAPQFDFAETYGSMLYDAFNADWSAEMMADAPGQPDIYAYRFLWGDDPTILGAGPFTSLGAHHGVDMDFITGREDSQNKATYYTQENKAGRVELSAIMQGYIKNFLYTGNPNGTGLTAWSDWTNEEDSVKLLELNASKEAASAVMTNNNIIENEVFEAMDADTTITQEEKDLLISTVMSGRFFSTGLDAHYNAE